MVKIFAYLAAIRLFVGETYKFSAGLIHHNAGTPLRTLPKCCLMILASGLPFVTVCLVTLAFLGVEHKPVSTIGLIFYPGAGLEAVCGMAATFVGILFVFVIGYHAKWFQVERSDIATDFGASLPRFCGGTTYAITGSIFEEIILRGYTFTELNAACGSFVAVVGSAAMFAVLHAIVRKKLPAMFLLNCFLFGIASAYCRLATGGLWASIGLHIGLNLPTTSIFGFPLQGSINRRGVFICSVNGPERITGGNYFPDGGLLWAFTLSSAALALVFLVLPLHAA